MTEKWNILTNWNFFKKKGLVLKEDSLWTASILKYNGLLEVFKFQCIFSTDLNCAMWINTSTVFIFSDLISSDLSRGQYLSLRIWGFFIIIIFCFSFFLTENLVQWSVFTRDSKNPCSIPNLLFLSEIPGDFCHMRMSADLSSVKCEFLWGTWEECLGAGQVTWGGKPFWLSQGKEPGQHLCWVLRAGEQLNISKGKVLLVAVSCEPMFCLLLFINIPLVLLMGKKLNTDFLALSQELSMPLDSDTGIFYRQKRMYSMYHQSPFAAHAALEVPRTSCPCSSFPSPLWCPSTNSCFPGLCWQHVLPFLQLCPGWCSMAWLP